MIALISPLKAQKKIAENFSKRRLALNLTQTGLAQRSGVALATLRKFEQKGQISLESLLKLQMVLGDLNALVKATEPEPITYRTLDEVLAPTPPSRKRGRRQ